MSFCSPMTRADIVRATGEYDRLGQEAFLAQYGFGKATAYLLVYDGRSYDSKQSWASLTCSPRGGRPARMISAAASTAQRR